MNYFKNKLVLLIEDDAGYRAILQAQLARVNAIVFVSPRGHQAIAAFEHHQEIIDCILIGTDLPLGVGGFEVYDVKDKQIERKGVIFVTSESDRKPMRSVHEPVPAAKVPEPLDICLAPNTRRNRARVNAEKSPLNVVLDLRTKAAS